MITSTSWLCSFKSPKTAPIPHMSVTCSFQIIILKIRSVCLLTHLCKHKSCKASGSQHNHTPINKWQMTQAHKIWYFESNSAKHGWHNASGKSNTWIYITCRFANDERIFENGRRRWRSKDMELRRGKEKRGRWEMMIIEYSVTHEKYDTGSPVNEHFYCSQGTTRYCSHLYRLFSAVICLQIQTKCHDMCLKLL